MCWVSGSANLLLLFWHISFFPTNLLCHNWSDLDVSFVPGDDTAHLCYSYFVTSAVVVTRSMPTIVSCIQGLPSSLCTAIVAPVGRK